MAIQLRPHQAIARENISENLIEKDIGDFIFPMATGSGKSYVIAQSAYDLRHANPTGNIIMFAPTKELVKQNLSKLNQFFDPSDIGVMCAGVKRFDRKKPLTIASIKTLANRGLDSYPSTIIVDECHSIKPSAMGQYRKFINECKTQNDTRVLGLTATPYTANGHWLSCGMDPLFKTIVMNKACQMTELIKNTWLCPLREVTIPMDDKIGSEGLNPSGGDYTLSSIEEAVDPYLEDRVKKTIEYADQLGCKSIMCVTVSIAHCERVYHYLKNSGQTVSMVHSKVNDTVRDIDVYTFLAGERRFICTPVALTTGFDCPQLDMIVNFRHIGSKVLYVQVGGRGTRIYEDPITGLKKVFCWFLDWTNTTSQMGPIDSITGSVPKGTNTPAPVKECPKCDSVVFASVRVCKVCGFEFPMIANPQELLGAASAAPLMSFDHERFKTVDSWKIERIEKIKGVLQSIKITFISNGKNVACEYMDYHSRDKENKKAKKIWLMLGGKEAPPESAAAAFLRRLELKCPDSIEQEKKRKRWSLTKAIYKDNIKDEGVDIIKHDPEVGRAPATATELLEKMLQEINENDSEKDDADPEFW